MPPATTKPYRLAVLSHVPFDAEAHSDPFAGDEYTLDHFPIAYNSPLFGVQKLLDQGYEGILFYSGFGPNILHAVGHALALVPRTDMDIIKTLLQARGISKSVVLSVHANENVDVVLLERLLGMHILPVHYEKIETLRQKNQEAYDNGARVFVGGGVTATMSALADTRFLPVKPNRHSIFWAIKQAQALAEARRQENERKEQLLSMLKLFREGVLCVNGEGEVEFSNDKACELLHLSERRKDGEALAQYYKSLSISDVLADGTPREDNIITLHGEQLVVTTLPISIRSDSQGVVAFIRDAHSIRTITGRLRESAKRSGFTAKFQTDDFKGNSPDIRRIRHMAQTYARHSAPILIHGETGAGKEVLAQAIHNAGSRRNFPFVAVNCAAFPESLLESELFGYEEGAFTGARKGGKPGIFETAHKGTLFLDEVGDMAPSAQSRLLRVLETKEVIRVGGNRSIPVDIRVISASHRPLQDMPGRRSDFRNDLFYRLAVLRLHIPPLRQRLDDLPLLIEDILHRYGKSEQMLSPYMIEAMHGYHWPGNVRELRSFIESYLILLDDGNLDEALFLDALHSWIYAVPEGERIDDPGPEEAADIKEFALRAKRRRALEVLRECGGNKRLASARLGISYNTLWRVLGKRER